MQFTAPCFQSFLRNGVALAVGLTVSGLFHTGVYSTEVPSHSSSVHSSQAVQPLEDGVYLYGQSSVANQIGTTYLVFEVKATRVVGAFYMPHSSFDCFNGTLRADQLALNVTNSYEKTNYPYSVALQTEAISASAVNPVASPVGLAGYRQIHRVGRRDRQILSTCKAGYTR